MFEILLLREKGLAVKRLFVFGIRQLFLAVFLVACGFLFGIFMPSPLGFTGLSVFTNPQPLSKVSDKFLSKPNRVVSILSIKNKARVNTKATPMKTTNKLLSLGLWDPHSTSIDDNIPVDMAEEMLLRYITETEVICQHKRKVGGLSNIDDGWKMVCLEPPFGFKRHDCLIYSFGINNEWSFEDQIVRDFGCKIYTYDPSMSAPPKRGDLIWFNATGLSGSNETSAKGWRMRTLSSLMAENNHSHAVIDYLKIDIEGSEWLSLATAMKDGSLARAKQLGIEFHLHSLSNGVDSYKHLYKMFKSYRDYGFRPWAHWMNFYCIIQTATGFRRSVCHELVYINDRFLPSNQTM